MFPGEADKTARKSRTAQLEWPLMGSCVAESHAAAAACLGFGTAASFAVVRIAKASTTVKL